MKKRAVPIPRRAPAADSILDQFPANKFGPTGAIDLETVERLLLRNFGPLFPPREFPFRTVVADNIYLEVSPDFVRGAILTDPVLSAPSYHADIFDCDDYVWYLKTKLSLFAANNRLAAPLAVGTLLTVKHAFSFCIASGSQLFLINTQSDQVEVCGDKTLFAQCLSLGPSNSIQSIYI
jgi:hypothetical protein